MRRYRLSFDPWGLLLFLLVMLPNFFWFAVPAPNDVLRGESATGFLDAAASVCQVLFVAALCLLVHPEREKLRLTPLVAASVGCGLLYAAGWVLYYLGWTSPPVILALTVPPCLSFLFFAVDRKNLIAVVLISIFTVCHSLYAAVNFLV